MSTIQGKFYEAFPNREAFRESTGKELPFPDPSRPRWPFYVPDLEERITGGLVPLHVYDLKTKTTRVVEFSPSDLIPNLEGVPRFNKYSYPERTVTFESGGLSVVRDLSMFCSRAIAERISKEISRDIGGLSASYTVVQYLAATPKGGWPDDRRPLSLVIDGIGHNCAELARRRFVAGFEPANPVVGQSPTDEPLWWPGTWRRTAGGEPTFEPLSVESAGSVTLRPHTMIPLERPLAADEEVQEGFGGIPFIVKKGTEVSRDDRILEELRTIRGLLEMLLLR